MQNCERLVQRDKCALLREIGREYRLKQSNISAILVKKRKCVNILVIDLALSEGERHLISGSLGTVLQEWRLTCVHAFTQPYLPNCGRISKPHGKVE